MSEFKKNPDSVFDQAKGHPVAVLDDNKIAFYIFEAQLFEAMLGELANEDLCKLALKRAAEKDQAVEVDINDI